MTPLMVNLVQEHAREARSFLIGQCREEKEVFPWSSHYNPAGSSLKGT